MRLMCDCRAIMIVCDASIEVAALCVVQMEATTVWLVALVSTRQRWR